MSESDERTNYSETQEIDDQDQPQQKVEDSQEESTITGDSNSKDEPEKNKIGHGSIPKVYYVKRLEKVLSLCSTTPVSYTHLTLPTICSV